MWVLFEEGPSAWSVVHDKNILRASPLVHIEVGSEYKFLYCGAEYTGTVLAVDECHDVVNNQLKALTKKRKSAPPLKAADDPQLPNKRRISAPVFYGQRPNSAPSSKPPCKKPAPPKMTEEEKRRKKILEHNKQEAEKRSKEKILSKLKSAEDKGHGADPAWEPDSEDDSYEKDDQGDDLFDEDFVVNEVTAQAIARKQERVNLLRGLHSKETMSEPASLSKPVKSPSKEALKEQLELLKMKLEVAYDNQKGGKLSVNDGLQQRDQSPGDRGNVSEELGGEKHSTRSSDLADHYDSSMSHNDNYEDDHELFADEIETIMKSANLDYQLYGKQADTSKLLREIYCKTNVLTKALTNSSNISHVLRRLMEGVFIPSKIVECTVTGKSWNAGGKDHSDKSRIPLHPKALEAICDFANAVARRKKWKGKKSLAQCTSVFSHKLGEMREKVKAGTLKD